MRATPAPLGEVRLPIASSHPAFEGHFPGDPILPGVALLDMVVGALQDCLGAELRLTEIPSLRWRAVVRPGETLEVRLSRLADDGHFSFEVRRAEELVSHGTLVAIGTPE